MGIRFDASKKKGIYKIAYCIYWWIFISPGKFWIDAFDWDRFDIDDDFDLDQLATGWILTIVLLSPVLLTVINIIFKEIAAFWTGCFIAGMLLFSIGILIHEKRKQQQKPTSVIKIGIILAIFYLVLVISAYHILEIRELAKWIK